MEHRDITETIRGFQKGFTTDNNIRLDEGIPFTSDIDEANNMLVIAIVID